MPTSANGRWGEAAARLFLEARGYTILDTNFRTRYGEIDVIVRDSRTIIFVEVKTRERDTGAAESSVDIRKRRRILSAARTHVQRDPAAHYRFDVIVVIRAMGSDRARIRHYKGAFDTDLDF